VARSARSLQELEAIINPFLRSLKISHTQFITPHDLDYYFFRSLFSDRHIDAPKVHHIGAQYERVNGDVYRVRSLLESYPAEREGIRRGDEIVSADGLAFQPVDSFEQGHGSVLKIQRGKQTLSVKVTPIFESFHASLANATRASVRIITTDKQKIGYVHLWSGTDNRFLEELKTAVADTFRDVDSVILDLRDGYGGAWYDYLDPFFKDRRDYFRSTRIAKDGTKTTATASEVGPHPYFSGPMVVLINGGVRSGKEALAYQFKKSKRATLIGTSTPGYFSVGGINFHEEDRGYLLYLAVEHVLLDGNVIEQRGISPHIEVKYDVENGRDAPLLKAISFLSGENVARFQKNPGPWNRFHQDASMQKAKH
jgi:carboxyl-terminal processing protease